MGAGSFPAAGSAGARVAGGWVSLRSTHPTGHPSGPLRPAGWGAWGWVLFAVWLVCGATIWQTAGAASAAATPGLPTAAEIEAKIKEAEATKGGDEAARTALIEAYKRAASYLDSAKEYAAKATGFTRALNEAPDQAADIRRQVAADEPKPSGPTPEALAALSDDDLTQQLTKVRAEATAAEARIGELDKSIDSITARATEARGRLTDIRQALDQLETEARASPPANQSPEATQAAGWVTATRRQALNAESRALDQELASQAVREDLYRAQREQITLSLKRAKDRQTALQDQEDQRRKREAEEAKRETQAAERAAADKHPLVQEAAKDNARLTETLADLAAAIERFNETSAQIERERKRIDAEFRGARERIDVAGVNQALGQVMIDRRQELPDLRKLRKEMATRNDRIAEATLRQIRFREESRALRDLDSVLAELAAKEPAAQTPEVRKQLADLLEQRRPLIEKALAATDAYIRKQADINEATDQLIQSTGNYDNYLAQHLLWVRSAGALSRPVLATLPAAVAWLLSPSSWLDVVQVLAYESLRSPVLWLGTLAVAILLWRQSSIKRRILATAEPLRRVRTDRFLYTIQAIGLTLIAALPLSLAFLTLGQALSASLDATNFTRTIGHGLLRVALGLYFLRCFRLLCMPGGVADRHFRWDSRVLARIRRHLGWFTPYIVLVSLTAYAAYLNRDTAYSESLGRLVLMAAMLGTAAFLGLLLHPRRGVLARMLADNPSGWANRLSKVWYPALVGTPVALTLLAGLGYLYTAGTLFEALVQTAWLTLGLVLVQQLIVRWLVVTRRNLALQAALERQSARRAQAESREGETTDAPPAVEEPEPDLANLDEQTRELLHASIFVLAVLGLWWLWGPMLPALNYFKKVVLWQTTGLVDGAAQLIPVTAADAGLVVVILFVALVAAKNLPALIEILLLRRSSVNAGTRYAVRTLVSYAITVIAVLASFSNLGLRWSQVQWLVAALGVGIGFGLQEIVANFISGIIILFERPVRVGDTVTIGGTTGIVTKIEIRATTIRNWDRQELIVPNKEFITGRLLNWTLTDQLNRIVITVGIEYGSDARLALGLLTETALANPRVLRDPPPTATLDAFGDSALTLVLRCYLDSMEVRQGVTTEMHLAIEKVFREHGIAIAFPQREIQITAREPIEVRLHSPRTDGGPADAAPHP